MRPTTRHLFEEAKKAVFIAKLATYILILFSILNLIVYGIQWKIIHQNYYTRGYFTFVNFNACLIVLITAIYLIKDQNYLDAFYYDAMEKTIIFWHISTALELFEFGYANDLSNLEVLLYICCLAERILSCLIGLGIIMLYFSAGHALHKLTAHILRL